MGPAGIIPPHRYREFVRHLERDGAEFPEISIDDLFFRALPAKFIHNLTDNGPSFRNERARYNIPRSFSALYLSDSETTATAEARPTDPTNGRGAFPLVMGSFHVRLSQVRDLTASGSLESLGLTLEDLRRRHTEDDDHLIPRALALYCRKKMNARGLLTKSVESEGNNLVLFPDRIVLDSVLRLEAVRRIRIAPR